MKCEAPVWQGRGLWIPRQVAVGDDSTYIQQEDYNLNNKGIRLKLKNYAEDGRWFSIRRGRRLSGPNLTAKLYTNGGVPVNWSKWSCPTYFEIMKMMFQDMDDADEQWDVACESIKAEYLSHDEKGEVD